MSDCKHEFGNAYTCHKCSDDVFDYINELEQAFAGAKAEKVRTYNRGYRAGHEDTVESCYIDIHECDMDEIHKEEVE